MALKWDTYTNLWLTCRFVIGTVPGPNPSGDSYMNYTLLMLTVGWLILAVVLYLLRPSSLRGQSDQKPRPNNQVICWCISLNMHEVFASSLVTLSQQHGGVLCSLMTIWHEIARWMSVNKWIILAKKSSFQCGNQSFPSRLFRPCGKGWIAWTYYTVTVFSPGCDRQHH